MARQKIWTAEELLKLTHAEQDLIFESCLMRDLDQAPAELVARAHARVQQRVAQTESAPR